MSRNNTPSVLSSLNAYDSTDSEDDEGEVGSSSEEKKIKGVADLLLNPPVVRPSVHHLAPPPVPSLIRSAPSSKEPSPSSSSSSALKKVGGTPTLLLGSRYAEEDEDNFDFCPPPMEEDDVVEEEVEEEESAASGSDNNFNPDQDSSSNNPVTGNDEDCDTPSSPKRSKLVDTLLPPAPTTECDPALQAKFNKMMVLKSKGRNVNDIVQNMKSFRNPSIYNKLILLCNIDENGTNFPDQPVFGESSYYDELDKAQRLEMERRFKEKERRAKEVAAATGGVKVDFLRGTVPIPPPRVLTTMPTILPPTQKIRAFGNLAFKN